MDTERTRDDLIEAAALELRIIDASDTLQAADSVRIGEKIDPLIGELGARGVVYIANDDAIPIEIFDPMAKLLAIACEGIFGKPASPDQARWSLEERIKVVVNNMPATNRYLKVDRSLTPRRAWWTLTDFNR